MNESLETMVRLLDEITAHLKSSAQRDRAEARRKLDRITALSATMALTLEIRR